MNEKEIAEIRRRYKAEDSNITRIRGCYVNEKKEIVSEFNQSMAMMLQAEADEILSIMKKTLSGTVGKNLLNIEFSTQQVLESEEHKLLMELKNSSLENDEAVTAFYKRVIDSLSFEGSYLLLMGFDKYDVFTYTDDGAKSEDSSSVFSYIICGICPLKLTKPGLSYHANEKTFHNVAVNSIVGAPELGFMFPSFDDRAANIYNALYYTRNTYENHEEFVQSVFNCNVPLPAAVQMEKFRDILNETVSEECSYEIVQSVYDELYDIVDEHKSSKEKAPLLISKKNVRSVLEACGVNGERVAAFDEQFDEQFGNDAKIPPQNILDVKRFELQTPDVSIRVNPERTDIVKTRMIDGVKYILIRADEDVEVNGISIHIKQ